MKKRNTYDPMLGKLRKEDLSQKELQEIWDKIGQKAPISHTHTMGQVNGLNDALAAKAARATGHTTGNLAKLDANEIGRAHV